jgi:hypothetical protein
LYKVTVEITADSGGALVLYIGSNNNMGNITAVGTYTFYSVATSASLFIKRPSGNVNMTIGSFSCEPVLNESIGTMVVDWTPGAPASVGSGAIGIITPRASQYSLLYQDASAEQIRSFDNTGATTDVNWDWDANVRLKIGVTWGVNTSNVRQYNVFMLIGGVLSKSILVDYDGSFDPSTYLLLCFLGTWPQTLKNIQFFNRPLTDAEIERL